ncbi:hypothetical protein [Nocardioides sp. GCM10030258]|uniref:hypothetical protein n=1 Tax=unclassified Nocardioides TaxID=2615069 RepID=UPI003618E91E
MSLFSVRVVCDRCGTKVADWLVVGVHRGGFHIQMTPGWDAAPVGDDMVHAYPCPRHSAGLDRIVLIDETEMNTALEQIRKDLPKRGYGYPVRVSSTGKVLGK